MLRTLDSLGLASRKVTDTCAPCWTTSLTAIMMYVSVAAKKMSLTVSYGY
jgi:hypothetical protein